LYSANDTSSGWSEDIFIVKYDNNGNVLWLKGTGSTWDDWGSAVVVDINNNVLYVTGVIGNKTISIDNTPIPTLGNVDIFLLKYDLNGNLLWVKTAGEPNSNSQDYVTDLSIDPYGNVFMVGEFYGPAIFFGNFTLTPNQLNSAPDFIVKYSPAGNVMYGSLITKTSNGSGSAYVSSDSLGNAYVTAKFAGNVPTIIGLDTLQCFNSCILIAKYANDLNSTNIQQYENNNSSISVFPNPNIGSFTIKGENTGTYKLINELGQTMENFQLNNVNNFTVNINNLKAGIYFVIGYNDQKIIKQKILVVK